MRRTEMNVIDSNEIVIRHFGNTANNAYFNSLILDRYGDLHSELPIKMFNLRHAISAPAWEALEFSVPSSSWVASPVWADIAGAVEFNSTYSDLPKDVGGVVQAEGPTRFRSLASRAATAVLTPLQGKPLGKYAYDFSYRLALAIRPRLAVGANRVDLFYGADSLAWLRVHSKVSRAISLEHGTVRWIADGDRDSWVFRKEYLKQLKRTRHLWVTNLDPRTLEIAEEVMPGRWSALPHPFLPDFRVPFETQVGIRNAILDETKSKYLILLPSSQNWSRHHDKGSKKALLGFIALRKKGIPVGLVAVEWGMQLEDSKAFLRDEGVSDNVKWVPPMARFSLQRMMANVDIVWDQFGLDAFGALALHAVEQGTPLVSRGLTKHGEILIGSQVPWATAIDSDEIADVSASILEQIETRSRPAVIAETQLKYRGWLETYHSPEITAQLQADKIREVIASQDLAPSLPEAWARLVGMR